MGKQFDRKKVIVLVFLALTLVVVGGAIYYFTINTADNQTDKPNNQINTADGQTISTNNQTNPANNRTNIAAGEIVSADGEHNDEQYFDIETDISSEFPVPENPGTVIEITMMDAPEREANETTRQMVAGGASQTGTPQSGSSQGGTPQARTPQSGTSSQSGMSGGTSQTGTQQTGTQQSGALQTGTSQTGTPQSGSSQGGTSQTGIPQSGTSQGGVLQTGTSQTGTPQSGTSQGGTPQTGIPQSGTSQGGTLQSGTSQTGTQQSGVLQTGTSQTGTPQSGTSQSGTSQTGIPQSGTSQGGTLQSGTSQTGTPQSGTAQTESGVQNVYQDVNVETAETKPEEIVIQFVEWSIPDYMVFLNGGTFTMGSYENDPEHEEDEMLHQVVISSFYMSKYEVTQKEYEAVMGNNPSYYKGPDMPMDNVSWFDAVEYCNRLSIKEGLTPVYTIDRSSDRSSQDGRAVTWDRNANGFRLPTEAEWEYACRAGTTTRYNTGDRISRARANFFGTGSVNVGSYPPNSWGLYDMHGNVSEWCWDWYGIYNSSARQTNPTGLPFGTRRVIRGGNWFSMNGRIRSAYRDHYPPSDSSMNIGFRVVLNVAERLVPMQISNAP